MESSGSMRGTRLGVAQYDVKVSDLFRAAAGQQPVYGHQQFIVQGVWRQYGGWWNGNPADLFPARTRQQAEEIVALAGADALLARARTLRDAGALALACHLVDWVRRAAPANAAAWRLWKELFEQRAA